MYVGAAMGSGATFFCHLARLIREATFDLAPFSSPESDDPFHSEPAGSTPVDTRVVAPPPARLRHIPELDGARGLAALMVFFHHVCFSTIHTDQWSPGVVLLRKISEYGSTGVDLFFVLSGFLITSILIETRHRPSYYPDFYWKRVLRILPLYVTCLVLVLTFFPEMWRGVLLSMVFLVNFGSVFHIGMFGPFWSLAIEEQFYLIWPSIVRPHSVRQLARWSASLAILCILVRLFAGYFDHRNYFYTFYRCDGLALGALMACWFEQRSDRPAAHRRENLVLNGGLLLGVALLLVGFYLVAPRNAGFVAPFFQTGITLIAAAFIGRLIRDSGRSYLAPLRSPALTFFGLISYAFYMLHLFVLEGYDHLRPLPAAGDNPAYLLRVIVVLAGTTAAALVSRYAIELPALSLRKYVLRAPSPPPVTSESLNTV